MGVTRDVVGKLVMLFVQQEKVEARRISVVQTGDTGVSRILDHLPRRAWREVTRPLFCLLGLGMI